MDATVDDFFNEINEIAPPKQNKKQSEWQECLDKLTGYSYYWNTETDQVTWEVPSNFTSVQEQKRKGLVKRQSHLYIPPRAAPPLFPGVHKLPENKFKIYSIQQNLQNPSSKEEITNKDSKKAKKKNYGKDSDSEDEKIELISSYGGESESESDEDNTHQIKNIPDKAAKNLSDDDDDVDLLTKIHSRAKELKELEQDVSTVVTNVRVDRDEESNLEDKRHFSKFSLVAGYSDSEEENEENAEIKSIFPIAAPVATSRTSHSTLFPITQPVDVKDFEPKQSKTESKSISPNSDFDNKAFQRKRRIGVSLINNSKKSKGNTEEPESERKGFGFGHDENSQTSKGNLYPGFTKGGVMFVKSETLNINECMEEATSSDQINNDSIHVHRGELEDSYSVLKEKLTFLSEGRNPVLPVQVMLIQAETLFVAMRANGLKLTYVQKWLEENCSDLIKLEKEAAPEGWILQWDRSNKRYYYQNQATGESQWEYPQPDITRCDDAMDISTTPPPPPEPSMPLTPPLPPTIRSPTPPPPPIISVDNSTDLPNVPLPPELPAPPPPAPPSKYENNGEPLPPGVDLPELVSYNNSKENETKADPLNTVLDSFYSEIAAAENSCSPPPVLPPLPPTLDHHTEPDFQQNSTIESVKKKKKTKVKLAPGLSMKKKGVSQLVEKWKNVQKSYND